MKLDQLTQDPKKLYIVVGLVTAIIIIAVFFLTGRRPSPTATAQGPGGSAAMMGKGGMMGPGMMGPGGPGMMGPGMMGKGGPGMMGPGSGGMMGPGSGGMMGPGMMGPGGPGMMGPGAAGAGAPGSGGAAAPGAGAGGAEAGAGSPAPAPAADDGTTIPKGAPVEQFRADPFRPTSRPRIAAAPRPVLPPIVVVRDTPTPMVVPPTANVIPTSVIAQGSRAIESEIRRRMSGVLWNGRVYAILETTGKSHHDVVRPGDQIGENLWVRSISRDEMVLVNEAGGRHEEIVVPLRESAQAAAAMAPGGMPGSGGPMGPGGGMMGPGMMGPGGMMGGPKGGMMGPGMMGPGMMGGPKGGMMGPGMMGPGMMGMPQGG